MQGIFGYFVTRKKYNFSIFVRFVIKHCLFLVIVYKTPLCEYVKKSKRKRRNIVAIIYCGFF